ncbi:MAG: hypothetical protein R3194_01215 [Limnobacter sp.]|nr:hypothetical protein [Limnobacter sp.]
MKTKTVLFGGFLLLSALAGASYWVYFQADQFQSRIKQIADSDSVDYGHLRVGLGDLEQSGTFPMAQGQFRLNVYNRCNGDLIDLGKVRYEMGQLPGVYDQGLIHWFPPGSDELPVQQNGDNAVGQQEPEPLAQFAITRADEGMRFDLIPMPWMSTVSIAPQFSALLGPDSMVVKASAQTIKLAMVSRRPDDFLARGVQLDFSMPYNSFSDAQFLFQAEQFGYGNQNVRELTVDLSGEVQDSLSTLWLGEVRSGAMMVGDFLIDSSQTQLEWQVGDTDASLFMVESVTQSCAGFATAKSHEFNVRAALNSLIEKGFNLAVNSTATVAGKEMTFNLKAYLEQAVDQESGLVDLDRSLQIETAAQLPFEQFGRPQKNWMIQTGFFNSRDTQGVYRFDLQADAHDLSQKLLQRERRNQSTLASETGQALKHFMAHASQALYLKDFTYSLDRKPVQRVDFSGLKGVRIDSDGNARMLLD